MKERQTITMTRTEYLEKIKDEKFSERIFRVVTHTKEIVVFELKNGGDK